MSKFEAFPKLREEQWVKRCVLLNGAVNTPSQNHYDQWVLAYWRLSFLNTYRAVYTVKIGEKIYVLHAFQKKSTRGIRTPKQAIDLIKLRLKIAKNMETQNE